MLSTSLPRGNRHIRYRDPSVVKEARWQSVRSMPVPAQGLRCIGRSHSRYCPRCAQNNFAFTLTFISTSPVACRQNCDYPAPYVSIEEERDRGQKYAQLISDVIANRSVKPIPAIILPDGLASVAQGLEMMMEGNVSASCTLSPSSTYLGETCRHRPRLSADFFPFFFIDRGDSSDIPDI